MTRPTARRPRARRSEVPPAANCPVCSRPFLSSHAMQAHHRVAHEQPHSGHYRELASLAASVPLTGTALLLPSPASLDLKTLFPQAQILTCDMPGTNGARFKVKLDRPDAFAKLVRKLQPAAIVCVDRGSSAPLLWARLGRAKRVGARFALMPQTEALRHRCDATFPLAQCTDLVWGMWRGSA